MAVLHSGQQLRTWALKTVDGVFDATEVAGGLRFGCAKKVSGAVLCWGSNAHGELGRSTVTLGIQAIGPVIGLP